MVMLHMTVVSLNWKKVLASGFNRRVGFIAEHRLNADWKMIEHCAILQGLVLSDVLRYLTGHQLAAACRTNLKQVNLDQLALRNIPQ